MRFSTTTLGCKANQYDTGTIENILRERGHMQVKPGDGCDVCIVNTCAVTAESVRKSRQAVRRARKQEPSALIAICGCYSELERNAAKLLGADIIGGTSDREGFVKQVEIRYLQIQNEKLGIRNEKLGNKLSTLNSQLSTPTSYSRTRALLKIQDGCDNGCAYCIIPKARGSSRSVPLPEIAEKAQQLERQGYKEIVVTGIEISSYQPSLIDALQVISDNAPGARLRLGSLNPDILTAEFIRELSTVPRLCNHFHISLQSGCDETLARMGRRYTIRQVGEAIARLRGSFDNCGITADLIVGFPGESDTEFEQTLCFIERTKFSAMHIFPFSPRKGTKAAGLPGQVSGSIKQQRAKAASETAAKLSDDFKRTQIGKTLEVLFETSKGKHNIGHSSNYLTIAVRAPAAKNTLANVKITGVEDGVLFGEIAG